MTNRVRFFNFSFPWLSPNRKANIINFCCCMKEYIHVQQWGSKSMWLCVHSWEKYCDLLTSQQFVFTLLFTFSISWHPQVTFLNLKTTFLSQGDSIKPLKYLKVPLYGQTRPDLARHVEHSFYVPKPMVSWDLDTQFWQSWSIMYFCSVKTDL